MSRIYAAGGLILWDHILYSDGIFRLNDVSMHPDLHARIEKEYPGGCIANIAMTLRRLGAEPVLCCAAGGKDMSTAQQESIAEAFGNGQRILWDPEKPFCHCYQMYDREQTKFSFMPYNSK